MDILACAALLACMPEDKRSKDLAYFQKVLPKRSYDALLGAVENMLHTKTIKS